MRKVSRSVFMALSLAIALNSIGAEDGLDSIFPLMSSALPMESPSSIFDAKLGSGPDADAQLLFSGSWSSTIISSVDFQSTYGSPLTLAASQPLLFTQDPSLSLSFLLYKKIFVDAQVSEDVTQAKYSAGYKGGEDELVREFRVGNDNISFPALTYLNFGAGSYRSFGASLLVGDESFQGKAMVRYDQADQVTKRFIGSTELSDSTLPANTFVTGKFFLTLYAPTPNLVVYVQSSSGTLSGSDGNIYRQLSSDEYSYTAATGFITLSIAASTRVLAYYSGSGTGSDAITVAGQSCDFLYDPPSTSHTSATIDPKLQVLNHYATTAAASSATVFVENVTAGKEDTTFDVSLDPTGYAEVVQSSLNALSSSSSQPERQAYRQPFAGSKYGGMDWIYTTDFACTTNTTYEPSYSRSVVIRGFSNSSIISIDTDFVPGSVAVTRNGLPDYAFAVNNTTGVVSLSPPPSASEEIVITYMKESSDRQSGLLLGALGGFWDLGSGNSAWAALGASWSLPGTSYSSGGSSSPGSVVLTGGLSDTGGKLTTSLALAGRYTTKDSTGYYLIEGMDSSTTYTTTFFYLTDDTETYFTAAETTDTALASNFPSIVNILHSDGSTQKALQVVAGPSVSNSTPNPDEAAYFKVEDNVEYANYNTFSFYAMLPQDAILTVKLDDGSSSANATLDSATSVGISIPADPTRDFTWKRYILHYGKGDSTIYVQDSESGSEKLLASAQSVSPVVSGTSESSGSRMVISIQNLSAGEVAWIDDVGLSDPVSDLALLAMSKVAYVDKDWKLGPAGSPILSDLAASAFAQTTLDSDNPYASGSGEVKTTLSVAGFELARIGLDATTKIESGQETFSGGHTITFPAESSPIQVMDNFDYDPSSGAFGRSDSLSLNGGGLGSLSAAQTSAWTPDTSTLENGLFLQTWSGSLVLGPSLATVGLTAKNRSWPDSAPGPASSDANYASAWLGSFAYALPAYEESSDLRETTGTLSLKTPGSKEYFSASLDESSTPEASVTGVRNDTASAKLSAPLSFGSFSVEPYYSRVWKDSLDTKTDTMIEDGQAALGDLSALPVIYAGIPFAEFFSSSTLKDFSDQTIVSGTELPLADYTPTTGFTLSRDYGSVWYDFVLPSTMSFSYGRDLNRQSDTVTDDSLWSMTAKMASINLFGSMGAYPLGIPFDSDEYLTTLQATYTVPRDGSTTSLNLIYHGLATLHMGQADTFDLESKATVAQVPGSLSWSSSLQATLSQRLPGSWLLDLFESGLALAQPKADVQGKEPSIVSQYLADLASRDANFRRTISLTGGLSGYESDATSYLPGYAFAESYEAKISVPERLTLKLTAAFDQSLVASTQVLTLGFSLALNAVISF
jgi:hypothetical protein